MEPGWRPGDLHPDELEDLLFQAARLYYRITSGSGPELVSTSVRLAGGEQAYFDGRLRCFVHDQEERAEAAIRGPRLREWLSREETEPTWRFVGVLRVVLTDLRLLVLQHGKWLSYAHDDIAEYQPAPADFVLTLTFFDIEPLRLSGPDLPWFAVLFASLLHPPEELAGLPGFERFDAGT